MKLNKGDIFTIPISEKSYGIGQILDIPRKDTLIIIVFKDIVTNEEVLNLEDILSKEPVFLGYTVDALFYHKRWRVIKNYINNLLGMPLPYNKIGDYENMYITNYKGEKVRKALKKEFDALMYETHIAPIRFQNALKSLHGIGEWVHEDYDKLLFSHFLKSKALVENNS